MLKCGKEKIEGETPSINFKMLSSDLTVGQILNSIFCLAETVLVPSLSQSLISELCHMLFFLELLICGSTIS